MTLAGGRGGDSLSTCPCLDAGGDYIRGTGNKGGCRQSRQCIAVQRPVGLSRVKVSARLFSHISGLNQVLSSIFVLVLRSEATK